MTGDFNKRDFLTSLIVGGAASMALPTSRALALARPMRGPFQESGTSLIGAPQDWEIGPVIKGRNYSVNMPLRPSPAPPGWMFTFPGPRRENGHVHYVTRSRGPLASARGLRLAYRIDAARGTRFIPQESPEREATLSLFIQRRGDNWLARGRTLYHRWYSPNDRVVPLRAGEQDLTIYFRENWISVMGSDHQRSPREFARALADSGRLGITFGSDRGRGHGVFATRPARFTLLDFSLV